MLQETAEETHESVAAAKKLLQTGVPACDGIEDHIRRAEAALQKAQAAKKGSKSPNQLLGKWAGF